MLTTPHRTGLLVSRLISRRRQRSRKPDAVNRLGIDDAAILAVLLGNQVLALRVDQQTDQIGAHVVEEVWEAIEVLLPSITRYESTFKRRPIQSTTGNLRCCRKYIIDPHTLEILSVCKITPFRVFLLVSIGMVAIGDMRKSGTRISVRI
jgi:hypothetical protein